MEEIFNFPNTVKKEGKCFSVFPCVKLAVGRRHGNGGGQTNASSSSSPEWDKKHDLRFFSTQIRFRQRGGGARPSRETFFYFSFRELLLAPSCSLSHLLLLASFLHRTRASRKPSFSAHYHNSHSSPLPPFKPGERETALGVSLASERTYGEERFPFSPYPSPVSLSGGGSHYLANCDVRHGWGAESRVQHRVPDG